MGNVVRVGGIKNKQAPRAGFLANNFSYVTNGERYKTPKLSLGFIGRVAIVLMRPRFAFLRKLGKGRVGKPICGKSMGAADIESFRKQSVARRGDMGRINYLLVDHFIVLDYAG